MLHHYFTKSLTEFLNKINRGSATGNPGKTWRDFVSHDKVCQCEGVKVVLVYSKGVWLKRGY